MLENDVSDLNVKSSVIVYPYFGLFYYYVAHETYK